MRRLALLAASLRAGGVRVGVGELLGAHRALAAVDPVSRDDAYHALRTVLCSHRSDFEVFDAAFSECFGAPPQRAVAVEHDDRPDALEIASIALPRAPAPPAGSPPPVAPPEFDPDVVPAAW